MRNVHKCTDCGKEYKGIGICPYCLSDNFVYLDQEEPKPYSIWDEYKPEEE